MPNPDRGYDNDYTEYFPPFEVNKNFPKLFHKLHIYNSRDLIVAAVILSIIIGGILLFTNKDFIQSYSSKCHTYYQGDEMISDCE